MAKRPTLVLDGVSYVNPYMPVSELPYGYTLVGTLSEAQANDTGLAGCGYYAHPADDDSFFVFQECGTPIDEKTVDSEKLQWAYVRWIRADMEGSYARLLTLDDVRFLAQKGAALTWGDFDRYAYTETGSGLYIRVYEIDERFAVWIDGGPTEEPPMYIRLVSRDDLDDYVDVRTEDVEAFITAHGAVSTAGGADGPAQVTQSADPLDAAISAAILEHNAGGRRAGDFACESHVTLATVSATPRADERKQGVTVFVMALYQEYGFSGAALHEVRGSHGPAALAFEVDADGTHTLTEYWTPRDGGDHEPDLRARFPEELVADALDTQKYIRAQTQSCCAQAAEYFKVDTDAAVERLLEVITSSPASSSNPGDYIDAHPAEYRALIDYGDNALRYVFGAFLKGGQTGLRGQLLRRVLDDLIGGEALALDAATGQEYFDAWRAHTESEYGQNGADFMREHCPKGWLLIQMLDA